MGRLRIKRKVKKPWRQGSSAQIVEQLGPGATEAEVDAFARRFMDGLGGDIRGCNLHDEEEICRCEECPYRSQCKEGTTSLTIE